MPICIECCYPVPQLYHVLSSKKKAAQQPIGLSGSSSFSTSHPQHASGSNSNHHSRRNSSGGTGAGIGGVSSTFSFSGNSSTGVVNSVAGSIAPGHGGGGGGAGGSVGGAGNANPSSGVGSSGGIGGTTGAGSGGASAFKGGGEAKKSAKGGGGGDVRLMQCPRCKRFADKYVEHDLVVLFIDLVLVKPQVYRHLLFNRLTTGGGDEGGKRGSKKGGGGSDSRFDPAIQRLGVLLVLFDVYLTWSAIETGATAQTAQSVVPQLPILAQYLFYLVLCSATAVAQHLVIRELSQLDWFRGPDAPVVPPVGAGSKTQPQHTSSPSAASVTSAPGSSNSSPKKNGRQNAQSTATSTSGAPSPPAYPSRPPSAASGSFYPGSGANGITDGQGSHGHPSPSSSSAAPGNTLLLPPPPRKTAVSTAIFVSSCMKLFPILMVVWKYEDGTGQLARGVSWAVAWQNVEALRILLGCGYGPAATLVGLGWLASFVVGQVILTVVGLQTVEWDGWIWDYLMSF